MRKSIPLLTFLLFIVTAWSPHALGQQKTEEIDTRFHGVRSYGLRLDATSTKRWVTIVSERGVNIHSPSITDLQRIHNSLYEGNFVIPRTIRVTWQTGVTGMGRKGEWVGGTIVGDYTVPVAERIPDSVLDYIRQNGGTLRLKIRLKDDGVLIAWDVEEWYTTPYGHRALRIVLPGGDFREAKIFNGKVIDPGWQK